MKRRLIELLAVIILLLPVILPVFKPYVSGTADGLGHRFRLVSFFHSLQDGNLRPRWAKDAALGFGAPIFLYNYPLPYYFGCLFVSLGKSINQSGQLLSAFSFFFSGIFMFMAIRKLTNSFLGGLAGAITYVYAPYHLQMSFLYGAWGEELAFVFPPLILYLIICLGYISKPSVIARSPDKIGATWQSPRFNRSSHSPRLTWHSREIPREARNDKLNYSLSFLLLTTIWVLFSLSHNLSAVMLSPILLFLGAISVDFKVNKFLVFLNVFFLVILISSFFWLPGLSLVGEVKYPELLLSEGAMRGSFFKSFSSQLSVAFNVIRKGTTGYSDFTVGLPILIGGLVALCSLIKNIKTGDANEGFPRRGSLALSPASGGAILKRSLGDASGRTRLEGDKKRGFETDSNYSYWIAGLLIFLLICLYLTNYASNWIWNLPLVLWMPPSYVLYPFRFLIAASFIGALIIGILTRRNYPLAAVLIVLAIIQGRPYTNPSIDVFPFPDSYFWQKQTVFAAPFTRKNLILIEHLPKMANLDFLKKEEEKHYQESFMGVAKKSREEAFISRGEGSIYEIQSLSEKVNMRMETKSEATLTINRFYFPNWQARVDGANTQVNVDTFGRMTINLPKGTHQISLIFGYLPIEKLANLITYSGLVILAGELIFLKLKKTLRNKWVTRGRASQT